MMVSSVQFAFYAELWNVSKASVSYQSAVIKILEIYTKFRYFSKTQIRFPNLASIPPRFWILWLSLQHPTTQKFRSLKNILAPQPNIYYGLIKSFSQNNHFFYSHLLVWELKAFSCNHHIKGQLICDPPEWCGDYIKRHCVNDPSKPVKT